MPAGPNATFLCKQIALSEIRGDHVKDIDYGMLVRQSGLWLALWDIGAAPTIELIIQGAQKAAAAENTTLHGCLLLLGEDEETRAAVKEIAEAFFVYGLVEPPAHKGYPDLVQVLAKPEFPKARKDFTCEHAPGGIAGGELRMSTGPKASELLGPAFLATCNELSCDVAMGKLGDTESIQIAHAAQGICRRVLSIKSGGGEACLGLTLKTIFEQSTERGELLFTCWTSRKGTLRYALGGLGFETQLIARHFVAE